jgi:transposase-like protein
MSVSEPADRSRYRGYRFPPEVIAHTVWLYFRFHLSFRDVEELLAERGIIVSYEAIRHWCYTFGPGYAADLRRRRAQPGDKWHLDEVQLKINGKRHWLWRAVDQTGSSWTSSFRSDGIRLRPSASYDRCWPTVRTSRAWSSLTSS